MKRLVMTIIVIVALVGGACLPAHTEGDSFADAQSMMTNTINWARANPETAAVALGLDPAAVRHALGDEAGGPIEPLNILATCPELDRVAAERRDAVLKECCESRASTDERSMERRFSDAGYVAVRAGESIGVVAFVNFIELAEAVKILFTEMLRKEIDPERTEPLALFNEQYRHIGVALGSGTLTLGRQSYNVYVVVCALGDGPAEPEMELLNLVNQARQSPSAVATSLGIVTEDLLTVGPELNDILCNGLPPLAFDERLFTAARGHTADMVERCYLAHDSWDGRTFGDRLWDAGYVATDACEAVEKACRCSCAEPGSGAGLFFRRLFIREVNTLTPQDMIILNPDVRDAGISIGAGTCPELGCICGDDVVLMTLDAGAEEGAGETVLGGVVYGDENENGLYDAGEGVEAAVAVRNMAGTDEVTVYAGRTGYFSLPCGPGMYRLSALLEDGRVLTRDVAIEADSVLLFIGALPVRDDDPVGTGGTTPENA